MFAGFIDSFIYCCSGWQLQAFNSGYEEYDSQPLAFPFQNPNNIVRMAAFGIPGWNGTEPHNGIDLIVNDGLYSARMTFENIAATRTGNNLPDGNICYGSSLVYLLN